MKKSINNILSLLFVLSTLSSFALSESFSSENPIVLPTSDDNIILPEIYDQDDDPIRIGMTYIIKNPNFGGGAVYLGNIGHLKCPNAVLQHIPVPGQMGNGTPVMFVRDRSDADDVVRVMTVVYIKFFVETTPLCVNETVWKVNDEKFVVTGGKVGNENDIFKIMKTDIKIRDYKNIYKLLHCPPYVMCNAIGVTFKDEHFRLVTVDDQHFVPFVFFKA
ncbi:hypothetical protein EJD97_012677 [Solanum chilense]|uniref:Uncharacterized protein n=1 Tax=Solanum chilense TaxID=4083 RepID=A0A6N2AHY3_SOLCI|nr:hypothetical protein EJD97_012677 [Solanum chilense]